MQDDEMKHARNQFFEGEGPEPTLIIRRRGPGVTNKALTVVDMMNRMDPRLRRLVVRACHNSFAAAKVMGLFEDFVVTSFILGDSQRKKKGLLKSLQEGWWKDLLLECPAVSQRKDNSRYSANFFFPPTSSTGGFHRLLLQAICQFHGLNAVSRMVRNLSIADNTEARALIVTGNFETVRYRLLEHLENKEEDIVVSTDFSSCKPDWIVV